MTVMKKIFSFAASQILGDGCIESSGTLRFSHDQRQIDYVTWKIRIAESLGLKTRGPRLRTGSATFGIQTLAIGNVHIPKVCLKYNDPVDLVGRLDELGLLLWWLDDGSMTIHQKKKGTSVARFGYLCTEGFDLVTNQRMSSAIQHRFGIRTAVHIDRGGVKGSDRVYYRLYLNATNLRLFIDLVRRYIPDVPPSMRYKLNMGYSPNRLKNSIKYTELYNF